MKLFLVRPEISCDFEYRLPRKFQSGKGFRHVYINLKVYEFNILTTFTIIIIDMSNLTTAFLIFVVLVFGVSSYSVLQLTGLTPSINILIAACCRTLSLLIYRYYSLDIQEIPAWIVFQWLIPLVVMGELIIAACIVASGLGKVGEGEFNN